jgi:hypothetical protein
VDACGTATAGVNTWTELGEKMTVTDARITPERTYHALSAVIGHASFAWLAAVAGVSESTVRAALTDTGVVRLEYNTRAALFRAACLLEPMPLEYQHLRNPYGDSMPFEKKLWRALYLGIRLPRPAFDSLDEPSLPFHLYGSPLQELTWSTGTGGALDDYKHTPLLLSAFEAGHAGHENSTARFMPDEHTARLARLVGLEWTIWGARLCW